MNAPQPAPHCPATPMLWVMFCFALAPLRGEAGNITGTVSAQGKEGVESDQADVKYESRKFKFVERVNYAELRDFVVFIDQPMPRKTTPPARPLEVITQKDATFRPHVPPVVAGTQVRWPNHDEIFHNVFSFSDAKSFDLGLYKDDKNPPKPVLFDKPGRVDAFCSIHSRMHCIILVLDDWVTILGASESLAVTVKVLLVQFPDTSVATLVTTVVPLGKVDPEAGVLTTDTAEQLSTAVTANSTTASQRPAALATMIGSGTVNVGTVLSIILTVALEDAEAP